jgi:hypothetical protein
MDWLKSKEEWRCCMGESLQWIDPSGAVTAMDSDTFIAANRSGVLALVGRSGFFGVPSNLIVDPIPQQPGAREKYVQVNLNEVFVPVVVMAPSESELAQLRRTLKKSLNPSRGLGILRSTAADGVTRDLNCRCVKGLEGTEDDAGRGPGWFTAGLVFQAADPFWYDSSFTTLNFQMTGPMPTFLASPFIPIKLGTSGIGSSFTIDNQGDFPAWPVWSITGPGASIVMTNQTTGDVLTLTITLADSTQVLTIDTRPGKKTVKRENASNQFAAVDPLSTLWALQRGINLISVAMTGTTSASQIQLQYKQAYDGV